MRPDIDLRAALDTRGAAILLPLSLLAVIAFAALGGLLQPALTPDSTSDLESTVFVLTLPLSLIIPVLTVWITAGEWSDRSIQTTLLQRPGRLGVLASKSLAALVVFAVLVAVSIGLAAASTWIGGELIGEGADLSSIDGVMTTQLAMLTATFLFSLAMGVVLQSTVLGLVAAIGVPFVVGTAGTLATAFGSETLADVIRAVDLSSAAVALADGSAGAFELLPLLLLVALPVVLGAQRWRHREIG
jgi:ABC-2 type transport system permease protein